MNITFDILPNLMQESCFLINIRTGGPQNYNLQKQSLSINLKNTRYTAADSKPRETISVKEQLEEKKMKRQGKIQKVSWHNMSNPSLFFSLIQNTNSDKLHWGIFTEGCFK